MFPIRDHNPSGRTPYVVYALIALNVAIFLVMLPLNNTPDGAWPIYVKWGLIPAEGTPLTYVSSMFIHGGFMHLAGNMLYLWIFGDNLEDELGHLGFLLFYLVGGVCATGIHVLSDPSSQVPLVGASGAIAVVMGAYLLLFPRAKVDILIILIVFFKIFPVRAWLMLGIWLGLQVLNGVLSDPTTGGVAYWAHAGGFAVGLIFIAPLWLRRGGQAYWAQTDGHPPHPEADYSRSSIPLVRKGP